MVGWVALWIALSPVLAGEPDLRIQRWGDPAHTTLVISDCVSEDDEERSFRRSRESVGRFLTNLNRWRAKLGEKPLNPLPMAGLEATSTGACTVEIEPYIPERLKEVLNRNPKRNGPNCWNSAVVLSQFVPGLRYTDDSEFSFWLGSPLCRQLGGSEPREPGDIMAIRNPTDSSSSEVHGYIYISEGYVYSKNGFGKWAPFTLTSEKHVREVYGLQSQPEHCWKAQGKPKGCARFANAYRCVSFEDYLKKHPDVASDELKRQLEYMRKLECNLSERALHFGAATTDEHHRTILAGLQLVDALATEEIAERKKAESSSTPDERRAAELFLWQTLKRRAQSLSVQAQLLR